MRDVWNRIEAVLRASAPGHLDQLAKGATAKRLARLATAVGVELPDDYRASYAAHDGSGTAGVLPQPRGRRDVNGVRLLALGEAEGEREEWCELLDDGDFDDRTAKPKGPIKPVWWNPLWVPLTSNGGGDHLCLDLDPAAGGAVGQVIDFGHEVGPRAVLAPSLRAFLEGYAADLEAGRLRFDGAGELVRG